MTGFKKVLRQVRRVSFIAVGVLAGLAVGWMVAEVVAGTQLIDSPPQDEAQILLAQADATPPAATPTPSAPAPEAPPTDPHRVLHGDDANPTDESIVTPTRQAPKATPPAEQLAETETKTGTDHIIRTLPNIIVDRKEKTVTLDGHVVLREGMLELFVCASGMRQHESIIHVNARPLNIQLALLLLGLQSGNSVSWTADGEFLPAAGPEMRVFVEYEKDGKTIRIEAHEWMNDAFGEPAKPQRWVFAGSAMVEDQFMADTEGTIVCTSNFSSAILDLPFESTAVNDQLVFKARPEAIPAPGTLVNVILQPTGKVVQGKKLVWVYVIDKDNNITLDGQPSSPEDLAEKLQQRDKYLRKVEVYAHPRSHMEHTFAAMKVISGFNALQMQVLPLMDTGATPRDAAQPEPAATPQQQAEN